MSEPWVRFEDEHLLVVTKPAGVNTHRADDSAQDGMFEWVQRQRPSVSLSVLHRLDKATSGLLLFGKTRVANQTLSAQFEERRVGKTYALLVRTRRPATTGTDLQRAGRRSGRHRPSSRWRRPGPRCSAIDAHPHTGRTHQVRVHAAALGMPILGDAELGGTPAARVFLHAAAPRLRPPGGRADSSSRSDRPASFDRRWPPIASAT